MALRCCVSLACVCDLHYSSSKDISFHRFPVDQVAGREWIFKSRRGIVTVLQVSLILQARSKQCLIGPAIAKLSAGELGAGTSGLRAHPRHPNAC